MSMDTGGAGGEGGGSDAVAMVDGGLSASSDERRSARHISDAAAQSLSGPRRLFLLLSTLRLGCLLAARFPRLHSLIATVLPVIVAG